MRNTPILFQGLGILLVGLSLLPSAAPAAMAEENLELPFEIVGRVIFVKATVNGKGPLLFILDTGATETVITPPAASAVGLRVVATGDGMKKTTVKTLSAGAATVNNLSVFVFDPPQAISLRLDKGVDYNGILGQTFLSRFVTTIDFKRQKVRLVPSIKYPRRVAPPPAGTHAVTFTLRNSLILVPVLIGAARPAVFLFDTGSAETLLTPDTAKALNLSSAPLPGYDRVSQTILPYVSLGGAIVSNVTTIIHMPPQDRRSVQEYEGILGHPYLSHFVVTINYRDREILLTPNAAPDP